MRSVSGGSRRRATALDRLLESTPEPVLLAVLHRRIVELIELGDGSRPGHSIAGRGAAPWASPASFGPRRSRRRRASWTTEELTAALEGLLELDAMVKGAPGLEADTAQRRLAFLLWVRDRPVGGAGVASAPADPGPTSAPAGHQSADDQACSWTTRSLSIAKTQRPSARSSNSIRSGSM